MSRVAFVLLVAACGASQDARLSSESATLGDVRYDAPSGWNHSKLREGSRLVARWVAPGADDKQVVSVIRTQLRADKRSASLDDMQAMLAEAQRGLPHASASKPRRFKTHEGLDAIEVSVDFVPPEQRESYHRVHAFVIDGPALIHVLYTARTNDPDLRAFELVLDSVHRVEG